MKIKTILALSIMLVHYTFAQKTLSDLEQKELIEQDLLETLQKRSQSENEISDISPIKNNPLLDDLDDDGMDDDWETANGLDPNNPKDAWWDADNDHTLNLFEFQLGTDPQDEASPIIYEVRPEDGPVYLDSLIESAETTLRVIRMAGGQYDAQVLAVFYENFRIMLQGGWNDDFTAHNPELFPTTWEGTTDEALNILIPIGNSTITKSAVVLEGINFKAQDYFSLGGAAQVSLNSGVATLSLYNCTFIGNTYYGFQTTHKNQVESVDVFMVNSVMSNNLKGGIYTQVTDFAEGRWRIINCTINNPEGYEGGIDGLTADAGVLQVDYTNSINWGNDNLAMNFFSNDIVYVNMLNSNIDAITESINILEVVNSINTDPMFVDVMANNWNLEEGSPCIDTGTDVGLFYSGSAPDMGAYEVGGCTPSAETIEANTCGESYDFNGEELTMSGTYYDTLMTVEGCDSLLTLNLTIEVIDNTVDVDGGELTAAAGYNYQWIDCITNMPIEGENDQVFVATQSGSYAVELTLGECETLSECIDLIILDVEENKLDNGVSVFPNPSTGIYYLTFEELSSEVSLQLRSISGALLRTWQAENIMTTTLNLRDLSSGVYWLRIETNNGITYQKLLKH
jgi:hypothetical protein